MQVYQLDGSDLSMVKDIESGSGYKCSTFGASSVSHPLLAVGSMDGRLQLWDVEASSKTPAWDTQAHAAIVNSIDGFGGQVRGCGCACQKQLRAQSMSARHSRIRAACCHETATT